MVFGGVQCKMIGMTRFQKAGASNTAVLQVAESAKVRAWRALIFCATAILLCGFLGTMPFWHLLEDQARDSLTQKFLTSKTTHPQVVLVDFSDLSIQKLGGWPLERTQMADLVEELIGPLGAKVVGLDMMFPEAGNELGDTRLASLAEHGPLVLSHVLDMEQRSNPIKVGVPAEGLQQPRLFSPAWGLTPSFGYVANHNGLRKAGCVGHVGVKLDADGVMRRLAPLVQGPRGVMNTLAGAMLDCGEPTRQLKDSSASQAMKTPAQSWRLPFAYAIDAFDSVEAAEVLEGSVDPARIKGKYVLVGSSAVGLSDYVTTPLQSLTPGVLVHAQALAHLLDNGAPLPTSPGHWPELAAVLCLCAVMWMLWHVRKKYALLWGLAIALAWPLVCALAFSKLVFPWLLFVPAVCLGALLSLVVIEFKMMRDIKQRALNTLSHYVATPVLKQLYEMGLAKSLRPQMQDITVLVVDMRDYTRHTEEMSLENIAALTREFLGLITQPVLDHEGTLDRYSGDGLIAFWGAPLSRADHAQEALACAQSMTEALHNWNTQRLAHGLAPIGMRIGMESGTALVGDFGTASRSVFTAVGTCINTAARLQELGRDLQCDVVIGPHTAQLVAEKLQPLAMVDVKGLRHRLQVFTLPTSTLTSLG
jgi:adenylate cyclase